MYLGWYGLGRVFIEGLRTDSLYVGGTNLRVSQLVAGLCVVFAVVFLFYNKVFREHDPADLYLNRSEVTEDTDASGQETEVQAENDPESVPETEETEETEEAQRADLEEPEPQEEQ
jgi:hypothetical protein